MALQIIRNNIVNVEADAIVNTANPAVAVGPGVDEAIYTAAGWDRLIEARRVIGPMEPGQVAATPAFDLRAKYIIHAIGPAWRGGGHGERDTVAKCYSGALALALELGCESIAFPLMATGTYGFPKDEALKTAIREISTFLLDNEMEVMLVVYDKESFEVSGKLFADIKSYIEEDEIREGMRYLSDMQTAGSFGGRSGRRKAMRDRGGRMLSRAEEIPVNLSQDRMADLQSYEVEEPDVMLPDRYPDMVKQFSAEEDRLDERLLHMDKTFQEHLFWLIDHRGMTDPEVYKKANIDRKLFSKIRGDINYSPSKKTALALAIALELSMDETIDLLGRAGLALSPSIRFDKIIGYCIEHGNYDIYEINNVLFKYDQPLLGA